MARGGYRNGAGRPARYRKTSSIRDIDARRLAREGLLQRESTFGWQWTDGRTDEVIAVIGIIVAGDFARFVYRSGGKHGVDERVQILTTACNFGGQRYWFACPYCARRCAVLYLDRVVACRKCCQLRYPSQADDEVGNIWRKKRRLAARIGNNGTNWEWVQKPKGMHWTTFERIRHDLFELDARLNANLSEFLTKHYGRRL